MVVAYIPQHQSQEKRMLKFSQEYKYRSGIKKHLSHLVLQVRKSVSRSDYTDNELGEFLIECLDESLKEELEYYQLYRNGKLAEESDFQA